MNEPSNNSVSDEPAMAGASADRSSSISAVLDTGARIAVGLALLAVGVAYDHTQLMPAFEPRWTVLHVLAFAGTALWLIARAVSGVRVTTDVPLVMWAALAYGAAVAISTIDAVDGNAGRTQSFHAASYLAIFGLTAALRDEQWYRVLFGVVALALVLNALLGILQYLGIGDADIARHVPAWERLGSVIGHFRQTAPPAATFVNRNFVSSFAVLALPATLGLFLVSRGALTRYLSIACFAAGAVLIAYTRARAGWVACAAVMVGTAVLLAIHSPSRRMVLSRLRGWRLVPLVVAVIAVIGLGSLPAKMSLGTKAMQKFRESAVTLMADAADVGQGSAESRLAHLVNGLRMVPDHWFNGVGIGSFRVVYPLYHDAVIETPRTSYALRRLFNNVHNDFLQAFIELGVFGGFAFIFVFCGSIITGLRVLWRDASEELRIIALACVAGLGGLQVNALFSFPFQTSTAGIAWAFAGMIVGRAALARDGGGHRVGRAIPFGRPAVAVAGLVMAVLAGVQARDGLSRRESGKLLAEAYWRNHYLTDLYQARVQIDRAFEIYPRSSLVQETRALIYLNDDSAGRPAPDRVISVVTETLANNPNSGYLLIGLSRLYVHKALQAKKSGNVAAMRSYGEQLASVLTKLRSVAGFHQDIDAIEGYVAYFRGDLDSAQEAFERAARLDPESAFVRHGLRIVKIKRLIDGK